MHRDFLLRLLQCAACWAVWGLAAPEAFGQRIQFPSGTALSDLPGATVAPDGARSINSTFDPYSVDTSLSPVTSYFQPPGAVAAPVAPIVDPYAGGVTPGYIAPPTTPGQQPFIVVQRPQRLDQIAFMNENLLKFGDNGLGVSSYDINATLKFGFLYSDTPLFVTPGFTFHFFSSPANVPLGPRTYDAYVNFAWRPQIGQNIALDLGFTPGLYTDFQNTSSDMWRFPAKALVVAQVNPTAQVCFGVIYIDRVDIKLLPAGGVILAPNDFTRYEIYFPRPKAAWRLRQIQQADVWAYVLGEYGGGSWATELDNGIKTRFDNNDFRVALGLEFQTRAATHGFMELGYVFNRELVFESYPSNSPNDSMMFRGGFAF
ncbi:MAG TPA: hypothetical protein VGE52_14290 [Pirellulales bacterium]